MIYSAYSVYIDFPPYLSFMHPRSMRDRRAGMNRSSAEKQQRIAQQPDQLTIREGKGMVRDDERRTGDRNAETDEKAGGRPQEKPLSPAEGKHKQYRQQQKFRQKLDGNVRGVIHIAYKVSPKYDKTLIVNCFFFARLTGSRSSPTRTVSPTIAFTYFRCTR